MLFIQDTVNTQDINTVNNFFTEFDSDLNILLPIENEKENTVSKYITSLVSSEYQKSIEDIQNTKVGNKRIRKRSLQQVMQESFFYGPNRFGNNFIA